MDMILGLQQISPPALARLPCVACQCVWVLHSPMVGPAATCHCCQASEPPASYREAPRASHAQHPGTLLGAPQLHRHYEQEHREGTQEGCMGRGRRTHSTFLRDTFWLGWVAETVM